MSGLTLARRSSLAPGSGTRSRCRGRAVLRDPPAILDVSTPASVLGAGVDAVDLAALAGMQDELGSLDELRAAVGACTGFGAASPVTDEIVGTLAAALAATMTSALAAALSAVLDHGTAAGSGRDAARLLLPRAPAPPADGEICAVFAVDIVGFTRQDRDDDIRRYLHEKLYEFLPEAFDGSGVPWGGCFCEDRGDGALVVVPPEISAKGLIDPLPDKLRRLVRRHNHVSREEAGIQLRTATHIGPVEYDGYGFVGTDVNFLFRMLDARTLKRMLADSGAELGLVVSDYVYRSLVCRYPSLTRPEAFRNVSFKVKQTRGRAWAYLPGSSGGPASERCLGLGSGLASRDAVCTASAA